ncbi:YdeI/OmpD-associated family protein [Flavobacterium sp. TR2]|uniref:YdeI/OmpD-associated family protein n=1 Tax=Flavobacterium sp. TR2 TaxID=2977321 RepID=UPI0021B0964C|nr:YdeI/OmpD-associated family protein [Flavobacterium sp. TR2]UWY26955.1 YdeI/OmpD-associated family protein [Flavobacterium sp. TR2]
MEKYNQDVTAYIAKMADFAKPILNHLREVIFSTCPEVEENIKWGTPHYSYKGDHLVMMGGFKQHCSFSLYKAELMKDKEIQASVKAGKKFGYMDKIKDLSELPSKEILAAYIREAMILNENGTAKPKPTKEKSTAEVVAPQEFMDALKKDSKAIEIFESKSPSFRKNYIIWIADAKTDETRNKRIAQALEWIAEGKDRFWQSKK